MGITSIGSFSVPIGPGAFCLNCHLHGGALSVSPFRALTGAYQSSLVAYATGGIGEIWTLNLLNAIESLYPIGATTPSCINKIYADLRLTNCLIFVHIRPVRRHGLSFGERPLTSGPGSLPTSLAPPRSYLPKEDKRLMLLNLTQEWLPTTFTRHSEIFV